MSKINVIEMHATWLTINSIIGCTNGCKYCFLQSSNGNISKPKILVNPKEAINQLLLSKYYTSDIPINLLPNTDPFLNEYNIKYLEQLFTLLNEKQVTNNLIIVTKCYIPDYFINYIKKLINIRDNIVFYLSYSGLDNYIEPNVNHEKIKENFINLNKHGIKIIHYFRPLVPMNSTQEKIDEVLGFVKKYTNISVITGLKLKENFIDKINFWDEIGDRRNESIKAEGVWPEQAYNYFYKNYQMKDHYVFQTNLCALSLSTGKSCLAYYKSLECKNCNICPLKQRELCKNSYNSMNYDEIELKLKENINKIANQKKSINYILDIDNNMLTLENIKLSIGDLSYLTNVMNLKICTNEKKDKDNYFNTSLINAKPLILPGNMSNTNHFLDKYYTRAIELKIRFKKTEPKDWDVMTTLAELTVQIGHVFNVKFKYKIFNEKNRNIIDIGDEVCDVLLQICYIAYLEDINLKNIKNHNFYDLNFIPIILGQLMETFMEEKGYRYYKKRDGYLTNKDFIIERIRNLFALIYNLGIINGIDLEYEFEKMLKDANGFLDNYNV
ncbi:MAG: radical SAM protein [Bacilli bacterium]|nr:radical SAM protein [Bacilli bacterium]